MTREGTRGFQVTCGLASRAALAVVVIDIRNLNRARRILRKVLACHPGSDYGLGRLKERRQLKTRPLVAVVDAAWPQMDVVVACAHGSQSPPKGGRWRSER